jgi:hypothetical protein
MRTYIRAKYICFWNREFVHGSRYDFDHHGPFLFAGAGDATSAAAAATGGGRIRRRNRYFVFGRQPKGAPIRGACNQGHRLPFQPVARHRPTAAWLLGRLEATTTRVTARVALTGSPPHLWRPPSGRPWPCPVPRRFATSSGSFARSTATCSPLDLRRLFLCARRLLACGPAASVGKGKCLLGCASRTPQLLLGAGLVWAQRTPLCAIHMSCTARLTTFLPPVKRGEFRHCYRRRHCR